MKKSARPHAQIRQSQLVTTFGPGAMLDLPKQAVLIGGLEFWSEPRREISEERLLAKLRLQLDVPNLKLCAPPIDPQDPQAPPTGVTVWLFPEWFMAQKEHWDGPARERPLVHREALSKGRYIGDDRKAYDVIPIRFVEACVNGHISDIDWYLFVHGNGNPCRRPLWLRERGTSGELADVFVRCECGEMRSLATATLGGVEETPLGYCRGQRPWLGAASAERCGGENGKAQPNRLLVRSASNAYFPQVMSAISIPDRDALLRKAVDAVWTDFLMYVEDLADLKKERRKERVINAIEGFADEVVLAEIQRRKAGGSEVKKSIKQAEVEMLLSSPDEIGDDQPEGDFYARALPVPQSRRGPLTKIERVVRVDRLREVIAQVGFTRFESESPDVDGELQLGVSRAALARELSWLPAVENRGEGIFLSFAREAIGTWRELPAVQTRGRQLLSGFQKWQVNHPTSQFEFPPLPYILLHSLSHLLITAVSLECGYAASAVRERVYAGESGYGILLYTGTPDAEGTLGGLVQAGRRLDRHLAVAAESGRLCSNDPVCAQHQPDNVQEERFLHGAACHGCLLIAEPSCERRNEFLDRALVVATVDELGAEFFAGSVG